MTLDELAEEFLSCAAHAAEKRLAEILVVWKGTGETVSGLAERADDFVHGRQDGPRPIGEEIRNNRERFKSEAINGIAGFTMNERLYYFGLFDRYDKQKNQDDELRELYAELHATL